MCLSNKVHQTPMSIVSTLFRAEDSFEVSIKDCVQKWLIDLHTRFFLCHFISCLKRDRALKASD